MNYCRQSISPRWWRTWRYLQIEVDTAGEPLVLESLKAHATGYPFALGLMGLVSAALFTVFHRRDWL